MWWRRILHSAIPLVRAAGWRRHVPAWAVRHAEWSRTGRRIRPDAFPLRLGKGTGIGTRLCAVHLPSLQPDRLRGQDPTLARWARPESTVLDRIRRAGSSLSRIRNLDAGFSRHP